MLSFLYKCLSESRRPTRAHTHAVAQQILLLKHVHSRPVVHVARHHNEWRRVFGVHDLHRKSRPFIHDPSQKSQPSTFTYSTLLYDNSLPLFVEQRLPWQRLTGQHTLSRARRSRMHSAAIRLRFRTLFAINSCFSFGSFDVHIRSPLLTYLLLVCIVTATSSVCHEHTMA